MEDWFSFHVDNLSDQDKPLFFKLWKIAIKAKLNEPIKLTAFTMFNGDFMSALKSAVEFHIPENEMWFFESEFVDTLDRSMSQFDNLELVGLD